MGFFKFLKRDESQGKDAELDLPPSPPPLEGFEDDKSFDLPEFPKISAPKEEDFNLDLPEDNSSDLSSDLMDFPELEDLDKELPQPVSSPPQQVPRMQAFQAPKQEFSAPASQPQPNPLPDVQERKADAKAIRSGQSLYVRVDKFKVALDNINAIRGDLRKSEEDLLRLENLKHAKDMSLDKFKSSLDDLQKKLIFVDKTLFKGD